MDGRWFTVICLLVLPVVAIAATIAWFSSNPVAIFAAFSAMIAGAFYLLTYTDSFQ
ncbi:MAG TPA: hypothetical protein VMG14_02650 [Thermoplasmata archaeon]|jgi:hypothetical protein|nr:hypothetical protein [Thermoplasmata archaeon]